VNSFDGFTLDDCIRCLFHEQPIFCVLIDTRIAAMAVSECDQRRYENRWCQQAADLAMIQASVLIMEYAMFASEGAQAAVDCGGCKGPRRFCITPKSAGPLASRAMGKSC